MPRMRLHWPVDVLGYRIEPPVKGKTIMGSVGATIVANGGEVRKYDCLQLDGLYERLAACPPSKAGAIDFVEKYGLLRGGGGDSTLRSFFHEVRVVRSLLKARDARNWKALHRWMNENSKAVRLNPVLLDGEAPQLFFRPSALRDAIYLQFFEDLTTGAKLKQCARSGCPEWFKYGPGTGHRSTAEYCSPRCQKAHEYAKRKEGA